MSPRQRGTPERGRRGTPAGEVPKAAQPCGYSIQLDRQFIGRGSEVDVGGGNKLSTQIEALREAFEDAAEDAFDYFLEQYQRLRCRAPCHKQWSIFVPRPPAPPNQGLLDAILDGLSQGFLEGAAQFGGGVTVEAINMSAPESVPLGQRYSVSVTLRCHYKLECTQRAADQPDPDDDVLFAALRRFYDVLIRALRRRE